MTSKGLRPHKWAKRGLQLDNPKDKSDPFINNTYPLDQQFWPGEMAWVIDKDSKDQSDYVSSYIAWTIRQNKCSPLGCLVEVMEPLEMKGNDYIIGLHYRVKSLETGQLIIANWWDMMAIRQAFLAII